MKALGILAGPRKGFATDMMMDETLRGLREGGAEAEKVRLYDLDIKPCSGCGACTTGKCVIEDDHRSVLDKMEDADVVVFASPTYWSNVTSTAKAFFDRSAGFFEVTKTGPKRTADKPNRVILITSCGVPFPISHLFRMATGCMRAMSVFFGYMKVRIWKLYVTGMVDYETSKPGGKDLRKAYELGKRVASLR